MNLLITEKQKYHNCYSYLIPENKIAVDVRNYVCPQCNRFYDFSFRNRIIFGRVPLILPCKHSICEECVNNSLAKKLLSCTVCCKIIIFDESEKRKARDLYAINFYVIGVMFCCKPDSNNSKFSLKPTGIKYSNRSRTDMAFNSLSVEEKHQIEAVKKEKCSVIKCVRPADVDCYDCKEVYCVTCSEELHNLSGVFMKHKTKSLQANSFEIVERCKIHPDLILDFFCKQCQIDLCCYCLVGPHEGHKYQNLGDLSNDTRPKFQSLYDKANNVLRIMESSKKIINERLRKCQPVGHPSSIEQEITSYFSNLHAALQIIENNLKMEAQNASNFCSKDLEEIYENLTNNIQKLSFHLKMAKSIISGDGPKKYSVALLTEELEKAINLPCFFSEPKIIIDENVRFSVTEDLCDMLEKNFSIKRSENQKHQLSTIDELPADYVITVANLESSISSIDERSDNESIGSMSEKRRSTSLNSDLNYASDNSVNTTDTERADQSFSFNRDKKEAVLVTHIISPDSFFVQISKNMKSIQKLSKDINIYVKKNYYYTAKEIRLNSIYLVRYDGRGSQQSQQWYRGRIIQLVRENLYSVFFIDYGNINTVEGQLIMDISPELAKIRPFAFHCKLFNLYPALDEWDSKAITLMAQLLTGNNKKNVMEVLERNPDILEIDLLSFSEDGDMTSVREALLYMGFAKTYYKQPTEDKKPRKLCKTRLIKKSEGFRENDELPVIISYVSENKDIFIHSADFHQKILSFNEGLKDYYERRKKDHLVFVPEIDLPVAVKWTNKKDLQNVSWYRGEVVDTIEGQGCVIVFLVDYGPTVKVNLSCIRRLSESFLRMECQAVKIKLADIELISIDKCMKILNPYIYE